VKPNPSCSSRFIASSPRLSITILITSCTLFLPPCAVAVPPPFSRGWAGLSWNVSRS
jgi:hypothetical protein